MTDEFEKARLRMVATQIRTRGIRDPRVLAAMERVPRHEFVPNRMIPSAYADEPLPIGHGQTISQPFIVAYMSEALGLRGDEKVLEVGTGSGYQTAVIADLASSIWTVEWIEELSETARLKLEGLGYGNIHYRVGNGALGWPEEAPFDAIIVTAVASVVPPVLLDQLADPGRMILPVGRDVQELVLIVKEGGRITENRLIGVRFVPLVEN